MIEVGEARPDQLGWIEDRTGCVLTRNARALVALRDGRIVGMVAYDHWTDSSVHMHLAADTPAVWRRMLVPMWDYPFRYAGKHVVIGFIAASNPRSAELAARMGAEETYRIRDGHAVGDDWIIFEMRRENWARRG